MQSAMPGSCLNVAQNESSLSHLCPLYQPKTVVIQDGRWHCSLSDSSLVCRLPKERKMVFEAQHIRRRSSFENRPSFGSRGSTVLHDTRLHGEIYFLMMVVFAKQAGGLREKGLNDSDFSAYRQGLMKFWLVSVELLRDGDR